MAKQLAGKVTTCPLPYCPAPTLFVARRGSRRYHCIGCWRKFTPGAIRRRRDALQIRPHKKWLRLYSPQQSADGPPPVLAYPKLKVKHPKRPLSASIAVENKYSRPVTVPSTSVDSEYCDDLISTARWTGASAADEQSDSADSLDATGTSSWRCARASTPDLQAIYFPETGHSPGDEYSQTFHKDMTYRDEDSDRTSVGSVPDEHIADEPGSTRRTWTITKFGPKFGVFVMRRIDCTQSTCRRTLGVYA